MKNNLAMNAFKSKFTLYAKDHLSSKSLNKFKPALNNAIEDLVTRDSKFFIEERKIYKKTKITEEYSSETSYLHNVLVEDVLYLGVSAPGWKKGWRHITKDENVYDLISGYFYFSTQYITRGRACEILGSLAIAYGHTFDYIGSDYITQTTLTKNLEAIDTRKRLTQKSKEFRSWMNKINGLDPYVQRGIYFFIRFVELRSGGYFDEAITALDKVIDVFHKLLLDRGFEDDRKTFILKNFKNKKMQDWVNNVYEVRSFLGGHPSPTKWWDSEELYGDWLDESMENVKCLLIYFLDTEISHRKVERHPQCWSKWFQENCLMIYDSVWFHKLPI